MSLRYVWMNEALKPMKAVCAFDHLTIIEGYVRELSTGLLYHDACCHSSRRWCAMRKLLSSMIRFCIELRGAAAPNEGAHLPCLHPAKCRGV